jgi:hypothetical protein
MHKLDLADLASVPACVAEWTESLDLLITNTGTAVVPNSG